MTTMSTLKLTAAQKPTQMSAVQQRRNKLAKRLLEQMEVLIMISTKQRRLFFMESQYNLIIKLWLLDGKIMM